MGIGRRARGASASLRLAAVLALVVLGACAGANLWTDLTSVSTGRSNGGRIRQPERLPLRGTGYVVPDRWKARRFQYGTDELVAAIRRAAARVRARDRRALLGVADISRRSGGRSPWHNSHESGRDVDLLFYTTDQRGRPQPPPAEMIRFDAQGKPFVGPKDEDGYAEPTWEHRRFDTGRNWQLVEAFLTDASVRVQWVFVSQPLEGRLLAYAEKHHRPRWIIEYARTVMQQPGDSAPHDDHFHIRVYCTRADRFLGCEDRGPVWQHEKKTFKYFGPERYDPVLWRLLLGSRPVLL